MGILIFLNISDNLPKAPSLDRSGAQYRYGAYNNIIVRSMVAQSSRIGLGGNKNIFMELFV